MYISHLTHPRFASLARRSCVVMARTQWFEPAAREPAKQDRAGFVVFHGQPVRAIALATLATEVLHAVIGRGPHRGAHAAAPRASASTAANSRCSSATSC